MAINILGYASLNHDPSIAVVRNGVLAATLESEKITRAKHEVNVFPGMALRAVRCFNGSAPDALFLGRCLLAKAGVRWRPSAALTAHSREDHECAY